MNNIKFNRTLLIDGSYALHRSLSEPHNWEMINSKNKRTGGIFGTLRTINKELRNFNFFPIVVFDGGLSKRRLNLYSNYKRAEEKALLEHKENKIEAEIIAEDFRREYNTQRNDLVELLPLFGIPVIYANGWEGDDIIYILSRMSKNSIVVSDDKDLIQLIKEDEIKCRVRRPMNDELLDINSLKEKGLDIQDYIGCKSIIGDPSDNIPSACFQVGEKTSLGLLRLYENLIKDNKEFPVDEKQLTQYCSKYNITKRKAYLNFDINQFLINFSLTDLSLVDYDVNEDVINNIYTTIIDQTCYNNTSKISEIFKELEIKTFDYMALLHRVQYCQSLIGLTNYEKTSDIPEIINQKATLF